MAGVAFRVAAYVQPSRFVPIPDSVALPLNLLGIVFLVCGVWAWRANPSSLSRVFLVYTLGSCIHWGGSIGAASSSVEMAILFVYLAATATGDGAFLDLALRYPGMASRWGRWTRVVYVPAVLSLIAVPIAPFVETQVAETMIGLIIGVAFAMSILAGLIFIVTWIRATRPERRASYLTPIIGAMIVTTALDVLADNGLLPGASEAWDLAYALVPLVLARGVIRARADG